MGDSVAAPRGTEAEVEEVWQRLQASEFLRHKGSRVTMARWFAWCDRFSAVDKEYHAYLYALCLLNLRAGVYGSIWDCPIFECLRQQTALHLQAVAAAKPKAKAGSRKQAQSKLDAQRTRCKNTLHLAAELMGQPALRRRARMILTCLTPLWTAFQLELKTLSQPGKWLAMQRVFSVSEYNFPLRRVLRVLQSCEQLRHMGFKVGGALRAGYYSGQYEAPSLAASVGWVRPQKPVSVHPDDDEDHHQAIVLWRLALRLRA